MNRKGQNGFTWIIMAAVAVLIGLALYTAIQPNIGTMTQTSSVTNTPVTLPAAGSSAEIAGCGQKVISGVVVNATGEQLVATTNYTFTQEIGTDGYLAAKIKSLGGVYASQPVWVNCTFQPKGYIADSGGRSIVLLIAIFMAMLIVVSASPNLREWVTSKFS